MPNVAEQIKDHITLTVDCIDRLSLNAYVPRLQSSGGAVGFLAHRGQTIPSPALFGKLTAAFVTGLRTWCQQEHIPWVALQRGERKDDVVQPYRDRFGADEGVVLVGVAQERARAWRATKASPSAARETTRTAGSPARLTGDPPPAAPLVGRVTTRPGLRSRPYPRPAARVVERARAPEGPDGRPSLRAPPAPPGLTGRGSGDESTPTGPPGVLRCAPATRGAAGAAPRWRDGGTGAVGPAGRGASSPRAAGAVLRPPPRARSGPEPAAARTPSGALDRAFERQVRDALAHLYDAPYLAAHPLARLVRPAGAAPGGPRPRRPAPARACSGACGRRSRRCARPRRPRAGEGRPGPGQEGGRAP